MNDSIKSIFKKEFGTIPEVISYAPGRLEILGNHTDYNLGFVLSCATDVNTVVAVSKTNSDVSRIISLDMDDEKSFSIDELAKTNNDGWAAYIKGVVKEIKKLSNIPLSNFNAVISSTVPLSAGMSSSAALEVSFAFALGKLLDLKIPKNEYAQLGLRVENSYMGLNSGLLDQFSSIFGEKDKLILSDFRDVKVVETIMLSDEYVFIVINSMVKHNLVASDYNLRRKSCENAVKCIQTKFPNVKSLRDVNLEMLEDCRDIIDFVDYRRAMHIVGENERVLSGINALKKRKIEEFGRLLYKSHESSIVNFENSCMELNYLVELSKTIPGCIGARLSGGGFGGISIHLVKKNDAKLYTERICTAFKLQTGIEPQSFCCGVGNGAGFII